MIVLFCYEVVETAYTNQPDYSKHLLQEHKDNGVYSIIKNGVQLRTLFQHVYSLMKVENNQSRGGLLFVCLTTKRRSICQRVLATIHPMLQKEIIYICQDNQKYRGIPANRALLRMNAICYGESIGAVNSQEQMVIAVENVVGKNGGRDRSKYIIISTNPEDIKQLTKMGFTHILSNLTPTLFQQVIHAVSTKEITQKLDKTKMEEEKEEHPFADYLSKLVNVTTPIYPHAHINQLTHWQQNAFKPSMYFSITPKSIVRNPKSRQICSYIFKNSSDNRLYVASCSKPKQLINQQDIENKQLMSWISNAICSQSRSVPHKRMVGIMKYSIITPYEGKKGLMDVRPYLPHIRSLQQQLSAEQMEFLYKTGVYNGEVVLGLGQVIGLSLLSNQSLQVKPLFAQLSLINQQLTRTDFYSVFAGQNYKVISPQINISSKCMPVRLDELWQGYQREIINICNKCKQPSLLRGIFTYYGWQYCKLDLHGIFMCRVFILASLASQPIDLQQEERQPNTNNYQTQSIIQDDPLLANFIMDEDYSYFTKQQQQEIVWQEFKIEQSELIPPPPPTNRDSLHPLNPYCKNIFKANSFMINCLSFPVVKFLKWVKSLNRYSIIEYISMLGNNPAENYLIVSKKLKLISSNEHKSSIIIVDHVELAPQIIQMQRSTKTIFISRLKRVQCSNDNLITISSQQKQELFHLSSSQLIQTLVKQYNTRYTGNNYNSSSSKLYLLYEWVLSMYMRNKCRMYNIQYDNSIKFLSMLHKDIPNNKNRLKELQQLPDWKCLYVIPILKNKQKITLMDGLYQFLHVHYMLDKLRKGKWSQLEKGQSQSINSWATHIDLPVKQEILALLTSLLSVSTRQQTTNDALGVIRLLTHNKTDHIQRKYYDNTFLPQKELLYFNQMHTFQIISPMFFIVTEAEAIIIYINQTHPNQQPTQQCAIIQHHSNLIQIEIGKNNSFSLMSYEHNVITVKVYQCMPNEQEMKDQSNINSQGISNQQQYISNKNTFKVVKINELTYNTALISNNVSFACNDGVGMHIIVAHEQRHLSITCAQATDKCRTQKYTLSSSIIAVKLSIKGQVGIALIITQTQIIRLSITVGSGLAEMTIKQDHIESISNYISTANRRVFPHVSFNQVDDEHIIGLHCQNQLQLVWIGCNYARSTNKIIHPHKIKTIGFSQDGFSYNKDEKCVLVSFRDNDSLEIFKISKHAQIEFKHRFYWVQGACNKIQICNNLLFMKGLNYLRRIQLPTF